MILGIPMGSVGAALGGDASILAFWIRALFLAALFVYPLSRIISLLVRKYATRSGYWNQVGEYWGGVRYEKRTYEYNTNYLSL